MRLSTGSLAAASARHPQRTIGAWIVVAVLAIAAIVTLLGGSLSTEGSPTNNPESERADDVRLAAFPPGPATAVSDIVVIRSDEYTVDSPQFEALVRNFVDDGEIPTLADASTYLEDENEGLVSQGRHATIIRAVLLPSVMKLLGEANWDLPGWLEWLPHLQVEGGGPGRHGSAVLQR
jgi:uncharacterized membrane protein YdfJ with MMPL/SSD domain